MSQYTCGIHVGCITVYICGILQHTCGVSQYTCGVYHSTHVECVIVHKWSVSHHTCRSWRPFGTLLWACGFWYGVFLIIDMLVGPVEEGRIQADSSDHYPSLSLPMECPQKKLWRVSSTFRCYGMTWHNQMRLSRWIQRENVVRCISADLEVEAGSGLLWELQGKELRAALELAAILTRNREENGSNRPSQETEFFPNLNDFGSKFFLSTFTWEIGQNEVLISVLRDQT